MSKKNENNETVVEDEYYLPDDSENENVKEDKKTELAILKEKNKAKQLELEDKRFEFEKAEAAKKHEFDEKKLESDTKLEERKIAVTEKANTIAEEQVKADKKKTKLDMIFGIAKIVVPVACTVAGTVVSYKKHRESMIFEETGSYLTATGKDSSQELKDSIKDLKQIDKKI